LDALPESIKLSISAFIRAGGKAFISWRKFMANFDPHDPKFLGYPLYFDIDHYIKAVEGMICADEIEFAFEMIDRVPAWYRENPHPELVRMKKILYENLYDCYDYGSDAEEAGWTKEDAEKQFLTAYTHPRGEVLLDLVDHLNCPWICELSTSHGLLPLGLAREKRKFHFFGKNLNHPALEKLKGWLGPEIWREYPAVDQKTIFVFTEALEHSYREEDLLHAYNKLAIDFDYILLSVPYGCLGGGLPNWRTRRLGHIRGYTKDEFLSLAHRFFPAREWRMIVANSIVLVGKRK